MTTLILDSEPFKSSWNCISRVSSFRIVSYSWMKQDMKVGHNVDLNGGTMVHSHWIKCLAYNLKLSKNTTLHSGRRPVTMVFWRIRIYRRIMLSLTNKSWLREKVADWLMGGSHGVIGWNWLILAYVSVLQDENMSGLLIWEYKEIDFF